MTVLILVVDDNPDDVRVTLDALREGQTPRVVTALEDGVEALAYLQRQAPYAAAPRPQLILLDLNLPRKNGWEVLEELKANSDLRSIPIVIWTSSDLEQDVRRAYRLGANCYVPKPLDLDEFIAAVKKVEAFWLGLARVPAG